MEEIVSELSHGEKLCDSIFLLYQPTVPIQLEVVFVHGLEHHNCRDAYWKTWLARDGTPNNVWPMTWLPDEFSSAKVFALKYDASITQFAIGGRMDLFLVGEMLVQEMVMSGEIGQNGVPVVFVCHGFGCLVAKQIVICAKHHFAQDTWAEKLLENIGAILFYSTSHYGSHLAKSSPYFSSLGGGGKGPLLENLKVLSTGFSRLNQEFEQVSEEHSWYFASVVGMRITEPFGEMVVEEASSRHEGGNYLGLSDDHFDVVRPKTKMDSSYLWLTNCLKEVLDRYVVKLAPQVESLVLDSFVRLEVQEEALKRKLQEVSIVGMVGVGGSGKTMLARAIYQSLRKDFERSCYLDDVKSKASLDEVLITLLQNLGIKDKKTGCIVEQSSLHDCKKSLLEDLKTYVKQHRVLVVVDDVGTKENFSSLLKDMDFLNGNKESKVIVTCRNWQVLKDYVQGSGRYEVEPMMFGQDIELFSYHAFEGARTLGERRQLLFGYLSKDSSEHLIDEFESTCDDVVKACGGLPLSLEVMGCCLGGYLADGDLSSMDCLDCWKGALEKLVHAEPLEGGVDNDRLWKVLQISYDCLHENEQNMFLDIACFFCDSVRYSEQTLLRIWGGKHAKKIEFRNLKERCLVKINKEDESVTMHNQLRDMGRAIVRRQCKGVLRKMTRLWDFVDVSKLLQSNEVIAPRVQGLSLGEWDVTPMAIMEGNSIGTSKRQKIDKKMGFSLYCPWMRLLNLEEVEENAIEAISIKGSSCIQWVCLKGTNISKLPKFVRACNEICVLDMRDCRYLKSFDESIENLVNLLELNLSKCINLVSIPNSLGNMVNLAKLDLSDCKRLTSLPNSIGNLVNLSTLDISSCEGLTSLPDSIGMLVNLSTLDIFGCKGLTTLPDSIGMLVNLSTLDIFGCKGLTALPDFIGLLVNLSTLNIFGCKGLTTLPDFIGLLVNLSKLCLSNCEWLTRLPDSIGMLVNLSELYLQNCERFTTLLDSIGLLVNLSTLDISGWKGLTSLPDSIGNLVNLSTLDISGCEGLTSLPNSIGKLVNLSRLSLQNCERLTSLPNSIGMLVNLSIFDISGCTGFTSLPDSIGMLLNLSTLDIFGCTGLTNLPNSIGKLVNLLGLSLQNEQLNDEKMEDTSKVQEVNMEILGMLPLYSNISAPNISDAWPTTEPIKTRNKQPYQPISSGHDMLLGSHDGAFKFTMDDLSIITGNFSESLPLGQGGSGSVYRGQLKDGTMVAVKRIKKNGKNVLEIEDTKDFQTEADTLCREKHVNLVRLLGFLEDENELILVTEYVTNGNLRHHLNGVPSGVILDVFKRCRISLDVVAALKHLHNQNKDDLNIIHRDIKSSDVLITNDFRAKVAGFGFSQRSPFGDVGASSSSTLVKGTLGYMALEHSTAHHLKEQNDVYSFGELLVEIFTRKHPVESNLPNDECFTLRWVLKQCEEGRLMDILDPKIAPTTFNLKILEQIFKLVTSCLALKESNRPTIEDILGDLSFIVDHYFGDLKDESYSKGDRYEVQEEQKWDPKASIEPNFQTLRLEESKALKGQEPTRIRDVFPLKSDETYFEMLQEEIAKLGHISRLLSSGDEFEQDLTNIGKTSFFLYFNEIDNVFEFYFKNYQGMASFVGVGLECAKVILKDGWRVTVQEVSKPNWDDAWKNFDSSSSTMKVKIRESLEEGMDNMKIFKEALASIPSGQCLLLDLAQYFILKMAISSFLPRASMTHANRGSGTSSSPSSQDIARSLSSSGQKFSRALTVLLALKNIFSSREASSQLKTKNVDGTLVDPPSHGDVNIDTTVHVKLLPGGCIFDENNPLDAAVSDDKELEALTSQLDNTTYLEMTFKFLNEDNRKEIQVIVGPISFQFREENEDNYKRIGRFGWYHKMLDVSFGPVNACDSEIGPNHSALDILKVKKIIKIGSLDVTTRGTSNSIDGGVQGYISHILKLFGGRSFGWSTTQCVSDNVGYTLEKDFEETRGGFAISPKRNLLSSTLKYTYCAPDYMHELDLGMLPYEDYRKFVFNSFPMCIPQDVKFEGTWHPKDLEFNPQVLVEYSLITSRVVHMTSKEISKKVVKESWIKRFGHLKLQMESNEPLKYIQRYSKGLFLNHAMTHLNGKKFKVQEFLSQRSLNEREPETHFKDRTRYAPQW